MPPRLYLVRHAEGHHNVHHAVHIRDATLTEEGKAQCRQLHDTFAYREIIDLVLSSPLRRAIQTTVLSFGPTLSRKKVPYLLLPEAQEVSGFTCDVGHTKQELLQDLPDLFANEPLQFDREKINLDAVKEGWNSKTRYWAPDKIRVQQRAADLRTWLYLRSEAHILLVTHGAFLHYLTEDWTGDDPARGTAYSNCEVRVFDSTSTSSKKNAHIVEIPQTRDARPAGISNQDPHVQSEIKSVELREL
ncbi:phosphoglycerate mutase-like protein [Dothidotthia symphoricarpi CBS 119687]|uniref:Phosphoglycerate mutase-like protein n=1 Tax=Dothidotthia symphoricarpi CBS 119687 TaxID=1392245 RepID=A0A6A6ARU6_9PLEO|nr:phosphoglycerate mutase-like protein [Dothidotthia symphoricarpi CBS 119687]KAF2133664.1 phosphoglycerate mutase-like protein [Dothidotthia symphoricarpi CBS 119687]